MELATPSNDFEQTLITNIEKFGWHCNYIFGENGSPPFAYSVGFFHSYHQPEIIVFGLSQNLSHSLLSHIAMQFATGKEVDFVSLSQDLLEDYICKFVSVSSDQAAEYLLSAQWLYKEQPFDVLQLVWPEYSKNVFPWENGASDEFVQSQPIIGVAQPDA